MATIEAQVLSEVAPVARCFTDAGFSIYLVGGIVRDLQLGAGLDDLDFDLTTDARPDDIKRILGPLAEALWTQGERFGTIGAQIGGREYEVTTHRAEWYAHESRKPDVEFGDDIESDLSRRDFTVNAMAIRLPDGELVDPFDGQTALDGRRLLTPIEPEVSFNDDPLRILRAGRFIARYGLVPTNDLRRAAASLSDRLSIVSAERIREELDKILAATAPGAGLRFLHDIGAMSAVLPVDLVDVEQLIDLIDESPTEPTVRRAVVYSVIPAKVRRDQIRALRYSNADERQLVRLTRELDGLRVSAPDSDEDIRRMVDRSGYANIQTLLSLASVFGVDADVASKFADLDQREDLRSFDPAIGGEEIMAALGVDPGPKVGEAVNVLRERRLAHGPFSAEEEIAYLRDR